MDVRLDAPLPPNVAVGSGTALFVAGTCFEPGERIESLALLVDGAEQRLMAHGMPRLDLRRATGEPAAYRSGFWGLARIGRRTGPVVLGLRARLEGGDVREEALARIAVATPPAPLAGTPKVAICMATFEPPIELFRAQVESIRAQTETDWLCVVADDCSAPARLEEMRAVLGDDPRFVLVASDRRLGFYGNFERALSLAPAGAGYVAPADQDDAWHPDKLATLLGALDGGRLVYSDQRVVARDGSIVADSYWERRANNHTSMLSLLAANAVTGAASLFPRSLLDDALPFPPGQFAHFHDHWLALTARALGDIRYVDRPLYDYVQHGAATLGHANATSTTRLRERLTRRRGARERIRMWRMHYFVDVCRLMQFAAVLEMRCGPRMPRASRRALARFLSADRSAARTATLAVRGLRDLKRERPQTLGAEWMLSLALVWRRMLALTARDRPQRALRLDAVPPTVLDPRPGAHDPVDPDLRAVAEKIAPLRLAVRAGALERVNLLIPTFDLRHFFGGYIAKLNLARALAERGLRVRIVTVDPVGSLPRDWRDRVESYSGLAGLFDSVEVAFGRESPGLEVSRDDTFVATTWWTAHIAHAALDGGRFLYLVQEYEPFTFAMGSYAALADESYRFPHFALFSTELLRDFFRRRGLGVYAAGATAGDAASAAFENAISAVDAAGRERARRPQAATAAVLRTARAACRAQHVRGRGPRARPGARERRVRRLGARRHRHGPWGPPARARGRLFAAAAPARRAGGVRAAASRARRRAVADVHPASQPGADRDGVGRDAGRHQYLREQDRGSARGDLAQPDRGGAWHRADCACPRRRRRGGRRRRPQGARQPRALVSRLGDLVRRRAARPRDRVPARIAVRVAVDGRSLASPRRGIAAYLTGMLAALPAAVEVRVVLPRGAVLPPGLGANVAGVRHAAPSRVLHGAAAIARRPRLERIAGGVDLVWLPAPAPVAVGRGTPVALTVHDLSFLERPGDFTPYERVWHRLARPRSLARQAVRVLADSEDTARRARERFGLDPARVCVVPAGPGDPGPAAGTGDVAAARTRHGLPDRYFVFVGALEPRKAVDRLVAALPTGEALVVVGEGRLADAVRGPGVHLVGPVDGAEKGALYAGALAVVLPSWCEGYGYPPLEGYAHGTPAIVSDLPALRETAGAGAVYVPPGDVGALTAALREVASDEALRARLVAGGAAALATRSWEAAGAALHAALEEAAGA